MEYSFCFEEVKGLAMVAGFHALDGLYFTRGEDGSVTVAITESALVESPVLRSFTLDVDSFASVVASMSARGEENGGFYKAKEFLESKG